MDKYEYKLRAEEIVRLAGKKQFKAAAKIADEIRWEKVKNIQMLCTVSEIYERIGKYDESKEVLLLAYNRSPNGKMIVYRLVELSIALKDYQEATEFYHEYMQLAPNDSNALPLKYKLYKGRGAKLETLIAILEEFKTRDYQEEWILELARLYHQAGEKDKCVEICNEIDLWFNKGASVIQALEIKKLYEPLTPMQEQKLQNRAAYVEDEPTGYEEEPVSVRRGKKPAARAEAKPNIRLVERQPEMAVTREFAGVQSYTEPQQQYMEPQQYAEPQQQYVEPQQYAEPQQQYVEPQQYAEPQQQYVEPQQPIAPQEPIMEKPVAPRAEPVPAEVPVAEAIIRMTRKTAKPDKELKRGFSILPKGDVVTADSDEFAFNLPDGVEQVELVNPKQNAETQKLEEQKLKEQRPTAQKSVEQNPEEQKLNRQRLEPEPIPEAEPAMEEVNKKPTVDELLKLAAKRADTVQHKVSRDTIDNLLGEDLIPEHAQELREILDEEELEMADDVVEPKEELEEEKSKGLFGKVFSKLKMEDDEMDDDFNDDYEDDDGLFDDEEEDGMVTRGLTGQYEKVVIDDDDDENDPLNVRLTAPLPQVKEEYAFEDEEDEEEYEYAYEDEDEDEEYEEITDDEDIYDDEDEEEEVQTRGNKRFHFFRNTMEDDEMFDDEEDETDPETRIIEEQVIPLSYAAKYDTLNLQKELAKSIQQLMDATEKETVDSTLENVKKMVEASNIPELTETMRFKAIRGNMLNHVAKRQAEKLQQAKDIEEVITYNAENVDEASNVPAEDATVSMKDARPKPAVELAIKLKPSDEDVKEPLENILTQEDDGQLSLIMPEEKQVEEQIAGQLNFEDVLREWEKQELLSEHDKEKRALEEARKRALEETQGIMTEIMGLLKDVIPKIGSIKDGEEKMSVLAESLEKVQKSLPYTQGIVEAAEESREAASAIETACAEAVMELEKLEELQKDSDSNEDVADAIEEKIEESLPDGVDALIEESPEEAIVSGENGEINNAMLEGEEFLREQLALHNMFSNRPKVMEELVETGAAAAGATAASMGMAGATAEELATAGMIAAQLATAEMEAADMVAAAKEAGEVSAELMPDVENVQQLEEDSAQDTDEKNTYEKLSREEDLNPEQREILAYFLAIKSLKPILTNIVKRTEYAPEHMIITGGVGSGKTSVAMRIIKAAQVNKEEKIDTIAKIKAELLNQKDVKDILDKVNGGVLIIEKAGSLNPATVYAIEDALYSSRYYVQIILVDEKAEIAKLLSKTNSFINDIQMCVNLPAYNNNELAEFAKTYADVNGYVFDGMAILALHSVIELFQRDKENVNLEDVKNIMDEAMECADRRNNKLFGKIFGKKNTEGIVLLESDFE